MHTVPGNPTLTGTESQRGALFNSKAMTNHDATHKRQVLIVEDDAFIAIDIECVMEAANFEVMATAGSPEEALKILQQQRPDLALLDYNLGESTSIPVARKLQSLGVPFMFVSGQPRNVVLADMDEDHMVISKPFRTAELVSTARSLH